MKTRWLQLTGTICGVESWKRGVDRMNYSGIVDRQLSHWSSFKVLRSLFVCVDTVPVRWVGSVWHCSSWWRRERKGTSGVRSRIDCVVVTRVQRPDENQMVSYFQTVLNSRWRGDDVKRFDGLVRRWLRNLVLLLNNDSLSSVVFLLFSFFSFVFISFFISKSVSSKVRGNTMERRTSRSFLMCNPPPHFRPPDTFDPLRNSLIGLGESKLNEEECSDGGGVAADQQRIRALRNTPSCSFYSSRDTWRRSLRAGSRRDRGQAARQRSDRLLAESINLFDPGWSIESSMKVSVHSFSTTFPDSPARKRTSCRWAPRTLVCSWRADTVLPKCRFHCPAATLSVPFSLISSLFLLTCAANLCSFCMSSSPRSTNESPPRKVANCNGCVHFQLTVSFRWESVPGRRHPTVSPPVQQTVPSSEGSFRLIPSKWADDLEYAKTNGPPRKLFLFVWRFNSPPRPII